MSSGGHNGGSFANGTENSGGGSTTGKKKAEEKANPKAVYEWAVIRWFGETKAADVEKSLTNKSWAKAWHTHPEDNVVCVNYYGEIKDIGIVPKNVAGGNALLVSPTKMSLTFTLAKGVKEGDPKKCREKVAALKGIIHVESLAGSGATLWVDPSKFLWRKAQEAAKSEGFDMTSSSHELVTIGFKFKTEGQLTDPLKKATKQKGTLLVVEINDWKGYLTLLTEKGAAKDDVYKKLVEAAGFEAGDVKRE